MKSVDLELIIGIGLIIFILFCGFMAWYSQKKDYSQYPCKLEDDKKSCDKCNECGYFFGKKKKKS